MKMRNFLQNLSGPRAVTVAMWAALLLLAFIVGLAFLNAGTA